MPPNPYILAADNSPELLPLLRASPALARQQDEHGYSLVHAAASYNHLDLLRVLVRELGVPVDLRDEDAETALFVVETVEAARCLVEELGLDPALTGDDGLTAAAKIAAEGDFPAVAAYLQSLDDIVAAASDVLVEGALPAPPPGMTVRLGTTEATTAAATANTALASPDPEFRRRIDELAARPDFHTDAGQAALRALVIDALAEQQAQADADDANDADDGQQQRSVRPWQR